jgi:uncharacterized membrane protein
MSRWAWLLRRFSRRLWVRAALFCVLAVAPPRVAAVAQPFIPYEITATIGADAVDNILGILASSMLAVTTFSLSTMVSAYSAATSNATPRATTLMIEDRRAQNAISTFLGTFLFSIAGIVALSTGIYGENGRVILFAVTILVIVWIVVTLLRWIEHLSRLGRVGETTQRVAEAAEAAIAAWQEAPRLGARPAVPRPPVAQDLALRETGYVQHIDMAALNGVAEAMGAALHLLVLPGAYVHPHRPVAWADTPPDEAQLAALRRAFTVGESRAFEQDPRYGLVVLAEIGSRALSAAINDSGTVISVIGTGGRLIARWAEAASGTEGVEPRFPRLHAPELSADDVFDDVFRPMMRDGAGLLEVGVRMQKVLGMLARSGDGRLAEPARRTARLALEHADRALALEADRAALRAAAEAGPLAARG